MSPDVPRAPDETPSHAPLTVVLDTGAFLRAAINDTNVSSSFLRRAAAGDVRLCVSHALLEEIRDVLTRPEIRVKNARLSDEALEAFIHGIGATADLLDPLPQRFHYERDPDDEHILNLAIEARAAYILTFDNDLLDLMDSRRAAARTFQERFPAITILTPGEMITQLNLLHHQEQVPPGPAASTPEQEPEGA